MEFCAGLRQFLYQRMPKHSSSHLALIDFFVCVWVHVAVFLFLFYFHFYFFIYLYLVYDYIIIIIIIRLKHSLVLMRHIIRTNNIPTAYH